MTGLKNGDLLHDRRALPFLLFSLVVAGAFIAACTGGSTNGGSSAPQSPLQVTIEKNITIVPAYVGNTQTGLIPRYSVYVELKNTGTNPIATRDISMKITQTDPPPAPSSSYSNFNPPPTLEPGATYRYKPSDISLYRRGTITQEEKYWVQVDVYSIQNNKVVSYNAYGGELIVSPTDYKNPMLYRNTGMDAAQLQSFISNFKGF